MWCVAWFFNRVESESRAHRFRQVVKELGGKIYTKSLSDFVCNVTEFDEVLVREPHARIFVQCVSYDSLGIESLWTL